MPTYAELATEAVYRAEYEPSALAAFNNRLRVHFGHSKAQTGSRGDNNHLYGRHRSKAWCLTSRFCASSKRYYGTTDARDKRGPGDALRATDVGVQGQQLREASARIDAAVRAGMLPELAEWFGTVDGRNVIGWYEGHASSSDSSHLYHLHLGYWTEHTDNAPFFDRLFAVITGIPIPEGDDMIGFAKDPATGLIRKSVGGISYPTTQREIDDIRSLAKQGVLGPVSDKIHPNLAYVYAFGYPIELLVNDIAKRVVELLPANGSGVTVAEVRELIADTRLIPPAAG